MLNAVTLATQSSPSDHRKLLGDAIRQRRLDLELTQAELAARILPLLKATGKQARKFDARNVSRWERGANAPTGRNLQVVAEALETTVPDLLGAVPPPEPIDSQDIRKALARLDRRLARIERLLESRNGRP
jgi:transcriptional regulator with XRE-family HTH domain